MQNFILKGREIVFCVSKSSCNQALYLKCYELAFLYKFWFTLCRRLREFMAFVDKKYLRLLGRHGFQEPSCSQAGMALGLSSCAWSSSRDGVCAFQSPNWATCIMPSSPRPHLLWLIESPVPVPFLGVCLAVQHKHGTELRLISSACLRGGRTIGVAPECKAVVTDRRVSWRTLRLSSVRGGREGRPSHCALGRRSVVSARSAVAVRACACTGVARCSGFCSV